MTAITYGGAALKPDLLPEEVTFLMIKPDAVASGYTASIINELETRGFVIFQMRSRDFYDFEARAFYAEHDGKPFFDALIVHTISGPVVGLLIRAPEAVAALRDFIGDRCPENARPGTLRARYGVPHGGPANAVHASDSREAAAREAGLFFS